MISGGKVLGVGFGADVEAEGTGIADVEGSGFGPASTFGAGFEVVAGVGGEMVGWVLGASVGAGFGFFFFGVSSPSGSAVAVGGGGGGGALDAGLLAHTPTAMRPPIATTPSPIGIQGLPRRR